MNMSKSRDIKAKMPSPKVIYASNESKSVLARNLEECCDNDKNSQSVILSFKCILARNCEGTEQLPFFYNIWDFIFTKPGVLLTRISVMVIGVIICSLGVSMYQRPDVGVSPYDSLSLIMDKKLPKISYFWCRMSNDVICALVAYFAGGLVGIGTVIAAFGLGPIVHFFNIYVTDKLLKTEKHSEN